MPVTPNFALPYPGPLDPPCDFAQQWCALSDSFQGVLDAFTDVTDRTVPAIPIAQLTLTAPVTLENLIDIPFDTISLDTAGWVDFDADRTAIRVNRAGIYVAHGRCETISVASAQFYNMFIQTDFNSTVASDTQQYNAVATLGLMGTALTTLFAPGSFRMAMSTSAATTITVQRAALTVFWHADRTTP